MHSCESEVREDTGLLPGSDLELLGIAKLLLGKCSH
jgi:hypothetical protein